MRSRTRTRSRRLRHFATAGVIGVLRFPSRRRGLILIAFLAPLFVNDTIHLRLTITSLDVGKSGNSGKLGRRFQLINQNGDVVQEGESDVLVLTRQGAEARRAGPSSTPLSAEASPTRGDCARRRAQKTVAQSSFMDTTVQPPAAARSSARSDPAT